MTTTSSIIPHCNRDQTCVAAAAAAQVVDNEEEYYYDYGDDDYPDYEDYDDFELNGGCRGVTTCSRKQIQRIQQRGNGGGGGSNGGGTIYSTKHVRAKETQRLRLKGQPKRSKS